MKTENATMTERKLTPEELMKDTDKGYLLYIDKLAENDAKGLHESDKHYSDSWKRRGGVGAFMMMARKWDRIENLMTKLTRPFDIFWAIASDQREEGIIDDIRDLRRYLNLVEAEMLARGSSPKASKLPELKPSPGFPWP